MATCNLFEEDEVYVENQGKGISFGLVIENADFFSSSDDDEADKIDERLQKGTIRVVWHPTGKETVVAENKVHLVDRSLMPGDIVRHLIQGQETQCGFVTDVDLRCHVHVLRTNKYIYNVNSKDLQPLQLFISGQEVLYNSWLGRIENVSYDLVVVFQDGAKCQVDEGDMYHFEDISDKKCKHGEFSVCHFYPGQELKGSMDNFSDAKWLHSTPRYCSRVANKKGKTFNVHVTIEKIVTKNVEIQWVFRGYEKLNSSESISPPPRVIEGENVHKLQVLDWFQHCNIQIGDRMTYTIKNDDLISEVTPKKVFDPQALLVKDAPLKIAEEVDNKSQTNVTSTSLAVEKDTCEAEDADVDDEDFESESDEKLGASSGRNAGGRKKKNRGHKGTLRHKSGKASQPVKLSAGKKRVPKERVVKPGEMVEVEIELTMSWVTVMWQDGSVEKDIPSLKLFPVHHLDDFEFFPGDFVLPNVELTEPIDYGVVVKADHHERTCCVHWFKAYDIGKSTAPTLVEANSEMSVYDIKDHPDYKYRPGHSIVRVGGFENSDLDKNETLQTIGQILQLEPNGFLVIKWADGSVSQHYPQEIFVVSDEADNFGEDSWDSEEDSEESSETWETESEHEIIGEDAVKAETVEGGGYDQDVLCEHRQELDSLLGRAETALFRLQNHLNTLGVTVQSPECFHDIIRIYRSCHDLDKILQSSFFNDPELQSLIFQAKTELKRDKANKVSRHLSQLFDTWSKNIPAGCHENAGTVAIAGKTIKVSMWKGKVSTPGPDGKDDGVAQGDVSQLSDDCFSEETTAASAACSLEDVNAAGNIKKEISEPALSKSCKQQDSDTRRLSDPCSDISVDSTKTKKKNQDALVGENCVSKAAKRAKSDGYDDSGREVKKSRDEAKSNNHIAQELCSLICQNLQKQILRIHEEVNKRTDRLVSSGKSVKQDTGTNPADAVDPCPVHGSQSPHLKEDLVVPIADIKEDSQIPEAASSDVVEAQTDNKSNQETSSGNSQSDDIQKLSPENNILASESCSSVDMEASQEDMDLAKIPCKGFEMVGEVQLCHKYANQGTQPANPRSFKTAVKKELKLFQTSLPDGIFVKGFENRLDLYSVMILGPEDTPYEDAVFLFDIMLANDHPNSPPLCFYHSFCSDRLNPNLYEDGKVCVSLLGTWTGKGTEVWTSKSNLLQVLLSIQGLILVSEPYYNEAGYEKQRGTQVGLENSKMYNEMAIIKTIQSLIRMCGNLPALFSQEIYQYLKAHGPRMIARLKKWIEESENLKKQNADIDTSTNILSHKILNQAAPQVSETILSQAVPLEGDAILNQASPPEGDTIVNKANQAAPPEGDAILNKPALPEGDKHVSPACCEQEAPTATKTDNIMAGDVAGLATLDIGADSKCPENRIGDCSCLQASDAITAPEKLTPPANDNNLSLRAEASQSEQTEKASTDSMNNTKGFKSPQFPLFPMSKGFRLTLQKTLIAYEQVLQQMQSPVPK